MQVLVAEDNHFAANQYHKVLKKNGHKVVMTKNGSECLEKYEKAFEDSNPNPFDVVILDNNMPKKNGIETAKSILGKNPNQRIIFASAYDIDAIRKVPTNFKNTVDILQKPFSLHLMLEKVEKK